MPLLIVLLHSTAQVNTCRMFRIIAATTAFAASSIWLTSWLYAEIKALGLTGAPSYVPAMTAASEQMPPTVRAIICGVPVAVFLAVVTAILTLAPTGQRKQAPAAEVPEVPAHS